MIDVTGSPDTRPPRTGPGWTRWLVHLGLIVTAVVSVVLEPVLAIHIIVGLVFIALVIAHLVQRRRVSASLGRRLLRVGTYLQPAGRLALTDALLAALTTAMLTSGAWDWMAGHPTRIRWHALTGVVLLGFLLVHTMRRRGRLRSSRVR